MESQQTLPISALIFPVMMLANLWIVNSLLTHSHDDIDIGVSEAEIMYQITEKFWNQGERQKALKLTIERAFEAKRFDVVVKAAKDLNPTPF